MTLLRCRPNTIPPCLAADRFLAAAHGRTQSRRQKSTCVPAPRYGWVYTPIEGAKAGWGSGSTSV
jgi:hypothetical protein